MDCDRRYAEPCTAQGPAVRLKDSYDQNSWKDNQFMATHIFTKKLSHLEKFFSFLWGNHATS